MPVDHRWQPGTGPGSRRLPWKTRVKRKLVDWAVRDARIRRMALNRIYSEHGVEGSLCLIPFDDHKVFVDPRDDRIAYSLLTGKAWQRQHLEAAFRTAENVGHLQEGGVFVDVGANVGLMTLYAMLSGRFERAIAIEPDPWNRAILERNLDVNQLSDRVTVLAKAASHVKGTLTLHRDTKNLGAHSLEPGFVMSPAEEAQQVSVERLDTILIDAGIVTSEVGFVKIDVEGHEFAALRGMPDLLAVRPPLMIEVTFDARDRQAETELLRTLLHAYGTVVDIEHPEASRPIELSSFQSTASQHELLFY